MLKRQKIIFITCAVLAVVIAAGCSPSIPQDMPAKAVPPTQPTIAFPSAEATAVMVTDTAPVPTATTAAATAAPAEATPTAALPAVPSTATSAPATGGAVISAENAKDLTELTVTLPQPPEHIAWLGSAVTNIPPDLSPRPQILVQNGASITPVTIGETLALGQPFPLPLNGTQVLAIAPDGSSLVIKDPSRVAAFGLDGKLIRELPGLAPDTVYGVSYASSGKYLTVTGGGKIQAFVYDMANDSASQLEGFETAAPVFSAGISPDGRWLAWVSRATMQFQDVNAPVSKPTKGLSFMDFIGAWEFSPDSSKMALYVMNKLSVYSVPDAKELVSMTTGQPVNSLAWSPDGKLLAGGYGGALQLWDASTLAPVASLPGPNTFTGQVSFSPDGKTINSLHENGVLGVWKVK